MIATFGFVSAWLLAAALDALQPPEWAILTSAAMLAVSVVVMIVAVHLWMIGDVGEENRPGQGGDQGGGGPGRRRPDAPQPGDGGSDPSWWPGFERQLAVYIAESDSKPGALSGRRP
jgi:hypothetical protein